MDTSERLREVANLRYALQSKSRLRLEFLGALSKLLRVHGQPVRDEVLASLVLAIPDELPGEGYASAYGGETLYGQSSPNDSPPATGIPPKTPPKTPPPKPPTEPGRPPKTGIPPHSGSPETGRPPKGGDYSAVGIPPKTTGTASSRKSNADRIDEPQPRKSGRKKRAPVNTVLSGERDGRARNRKRIE